MLFQPTGPDGEAPPVELFDDMVEAIVAFYRRDEEPPERADEDRPIAFEFQTDADVICSDFQRTYGIDITTEKMHWWRFMALLEGLYSYELKDRVIFRVGSVQGLSKEQRSQRAKLRAKFRIKSQAEKERDEWLQNLMLKSNENETAGGG